MGQRPLIQSDANTLKPVQSEDGSYTAYSTLFQEHYHSTKDGALKESLLKHVRPAYELQKEKQELHILDICFGLGLNTLATLHHYKLHAPDTKLYIYSPEFDDKLIKALPQFHYPREFECYRHIIEALASKRFYEDEKVYIELFLGDAREYIREFSNRFDIVYQDAFSPASNPLLWTKEYFADIAKAIKKDGLLTTYSTALKTRLALHENGFFVYLAKAEGVRNFTLASHTLIPSLELVDMQHKMRCNPDVKPLSDTEVAQNPHT